jgi:hypothetical protein
MRGRRLPGNTLVLIMPEIVVLVLRFGAQPHSSNEAAHAQQDFCRAAVRKRMRERRLYGNTLVLILPESFVLLLCDGSRPHSSNETAHAQQDCRLRD